MLTPEQWKRFQSHFTESDDDECWIWHGYLNQHGYGQLTVNYKGYLAHRLMWMFANNQEIPPGMEVLHSCDNPPCVNFNHLRLGTHQENMRDRVDRDRGYKPSHCPSGHEYTFENTYTAMIRVRQCITCRKAHGRKKSGNH